ncbi:hypothetical protein SteCoe_2223 [Stentor coeruleus]|uniref:Uncharacterized protein n=1 Tax=Stentor coeruleus TaxID=5963 RepID=A0A1R2CZZ0_9CILI|nr:hypothetical protein SteCoe_2223 [Stentor coeruleus]
MLARFFSRLLQAPEMPLVPYELLPRAAVVRTKIEMPPEDVWLTKRMHDLDICSRAQAEKMLSAGMIKVNGQRVWINQKVDENSVIEIASRKDTNTKLFPIPESVKIWKFYKPADFTTTLVDPYKRKTIYHYLDTTKFPRIEVFPIGQLDYHSEGLVLLTNSKDLAEATEFSFSSLLRKYEARINGRIKQRLIDEICTGILCGGKKFRPMHIWAPKKDSKSKNVWVNAALTRSHPRELRSIFERKHMHVNRLIRTSYGPYKLSGLKPGEFVETQIHLKLHKLLFNYYKVKSLKE